jgi:hypothetical protein
LDDTAEKLSKATPASEQLRTLLKQNKADTQAVVETEMQTLSMARNSALSETTEIRETARQLIDFQKQVSSKLPEMEAHIAAIEKVDLSPIDSIVGRAAADWPGKEDDLQRRLTLFSRLGSPPPIVGTTLKTSGSAPLGEQQPDWTSLHY